MMCSQEIQFPNRRRAQVVFPETEEKLPQAIEILGLSTPRPVIVLIGGFIYPQYAGITHKAIQVIARIANNTGVIMISGGTEMGVMAGIGQVRSKGNYRFPLVGIAPAGQVTKGWGSLSRRIMWWRNKWRPLNPDHTHFILTPGNHYGDESPWIVEAATHLSANNPSVTILINGGEIARLDIRLSLEADRQVIALAGTGRYADELASDPSPPQGVKVIPATQDEIISETIRNFINT